METPPISLPIRAGGRAVIFTVLLLCAVLRAGAQEPETPAEQPPESVRPPTAIEIDLTRQRALLLYDGHVMYESPISSGRAGHPTPTGDFSVLEKDINHKSTLYGKIVDSGGHTVNAGADTFMPVPKGCRFESAPMRYFLRFDGATGMHAGNLPGYPASHGCVRMPAGQARLFFNTAEVGTPVRVHGRAPEGGPPRKTASSTPPPTPEPKKKPVLQFPWTHR